MHILVLVAGTNEPSNSRCLAEAFVEGLRDCCNVKVTMLPIRMLALEHFSLRHYDSAYRQEEDFQKFQSLMTSCDGFVIATPVWNFSVPAHLKNLIDRMGSFALDPETRSKPQLDGKPFFLIFTGGVPLAGWKGMMSKTTSHVQEALQYFGGSFIGSHYEGKCVGEHGFALVVDSRPDSLAEVRQKGHDFMQTVTVCTRTGKAPIKHRLRARVMQWGERMMRKLSDK